MDIEEFLKELKHVANIREWYPHGKYLDDFIGGASTVIGQLELVIEKYEAQTSKEKEGIRND